MRTCENCGRSIVARNAQARYCSTRCRVAGHRAAKRRTIPVGLTERERWVRWAADKRPLQADGRAASSTNPATWTTHERATASTAGVGVGFVLGEGIGCIDLDHCMIDGSPTDEAADFVARYPGSYIEVSPSGDGLHIFGLRDAIPGTRRMVGDLSVETYSMGRYMTVTGNVFQPGELLPLDR
ncbi:hypothetical protein [Microbacterium sp. USHLN272]|uniref:hypothetical protein n=1 Tax=Microbacterium sp. USHLN272 TaxID=3081287 RepID=UPI00301B1D70